MTTAAPHAHHGIHYGRKDIQLLAMGVGALWAVVGILGFIPGITSNYGALKFVGPDSHALLLGAFQTSMLMNLVAIVVGLAGIAMSRTTRGARTYMTYAGGLFVLLAVFGWITGGSVADVFSLSMVDNWMLIIAGLAMAGTAWYIAANVEDQT